MKYLQLKQLGVLDGMLMSRGGLGVVPETVQRGLSDPWCPSSHSALEALPSCTHDVVGIAAVLVDQRPSRDGVEEVLAEGVVTENLQQGSMQAATDRDDGALGLIIEHAAGTQELILLGQLSMSQGLVDPRQGLDDVWGPSDRSCRCHWFPRRETWPPLRR